MVRITRRAALKSALLGGRRRGRRDAGRGAAERPEPPADAVGLLYDATLCIGCKACVVACKEANGLPRRHRRGIGARLRRAGST